MKYPNFDLRQVWKEKLYSLAGNITNQLKMTCMLKADSDINLAKDPKDWLESIKPDTLVIDYDKKTVSILLNKRHPTKCELWFEDGNEAGLKSNNVMNFPTKLLTSTKFIFCVGVWLDLEEYNARNMPPYFKEFDQKIF